MRSDSMTTPICVIVSLQDTQPPTNSDLAWHVCRLHTLNCQCVAMTSVVSDSVVSDGLGINITPVEIFMSWSMHSNDGNHRTSCYTVISITTITTQLTDHSRYKRLIFSHNCQHFHYFKRFIWKKKPHTHIPSCQRNKLQNIRMVPLFFNEEFENMCYSFTSSLLGK